MDERIPCEVRVSVANPSQRVPIDSNCVGSPLTHIPSLPASAPEPPVPSPVTRICTKPPSLSPTPPPSAATPPPLLPTPSTTEQNSTHKQPLLTTSVAPKISLATAPQYAPSSVELSAPITTLTPFSVHAEMQSPRQQLPTRTGKNISSHELYKSIFSEEEVLKGDEEAEERATRKREWRPPWLVIVTSSNANRKVEWQPP
ncbi:hypothetical protein HanIR_Chr10g0453751 [Helianthus annuus]|nr:hypothetical protein HanIR_Chr10g0453751 [Helianthus annuus]